MFRSMIHRILEDDNVFWGWLLMFVLLLWMITRTLLLFLVLYAFLLIFLCRAVTEVLSSFECAFVCFFCTDIFLPPIECCSSFAKQELQSRNYIRNSGRNTYKTSNNNSTHKANVNNKIQKILSPSNIRQSSRKPTSCEDT
jgi:hypothetical protein